MDYWATPVESLRKGEADCEDYAIAKYFTLRQLGVADDKLRITYYKVFPEQSTPVFNFCLFINERQGIRLRYYKRSC